MLSIVLHHGLLIAKQKTFIFLLVIPFSFRFWKAKSEKMVNDKAATPLKGKYTYVGLDIDTTGRRLIDEVRKSEIWRESTFPLTKRILFVSSRLLDREHRSLHHKCSVLAAHHAVDELEPWGSCSPSDSSNQRRLLQNAEIDANVQGKSWEAISKNTCT